MNLEIKEKYNNFIRVIENKENKEKIECLRQNINHNHDKYVSDLLVYDEDVIITNNKNNQNYKFEKFSLFENKNMIDCNCEISSGYTSTINKSSENKSSENKSSENKSSEKINKSNISTISLKSDEKKNTIGYGPNYIKNNYIPEKDLSLLDDDFEIKNLRNKSNNIDPDVYDDTNTIKSEFANIFDENLIQKNIDKDENSNLSVKNNLEKIYNKILDKKEKKNKITNNKINNSNDKNINNYELARYLGDKKKSQDDIIKKLAFFCEKYIFEESTRGWNFISNVYVINFVKLLENLKKIIFEPNTNIVFGFFYRDYLNPKINFEKDFTKYWVGYENSTGYSDIKKIDYTIKNKILYYSFKNLSKSSKFKKRIGKTYYKIFKKTTQVPDNKDLIIDIVFYVGIKKV
jgi:hypothetical protein